MIPVNVKVLTENERQQWMNFFARVRNLLLAGNFPGDECKNQVILYDFVTAKYMELAALGMEDE